MYDQEQKCYVVDYFIHTDMPRNKKDIQSFMLFSTSRKNAENQTRQLEHNKKMTIIKISTYDSQMFEHGCCEN